MLRLCSRFASVALVAVTVGCTSAPAPAPDTSQADTQAVRDTEASWVKDVATKDVERFVSYYADNVSVLMPNMPLLDGKDAVRAAFKPMLADPNFALTFQASRVEASKGGDFVYTQGSYTLTLSDPKDKNKKKTITDKGKYLTVFRKQADGTWKAVADMINSDLPANP